MSPGNLADRGQWDFLQWVGFLSVGFPSCLNLVCKRVLSVKFYLNKVASVTPPCSLRAARARAECKVQQVGVERGAARCRGEADPRVACSVDGADRAHVERMGERRILFAVEEDAHVPSGGDEGNGVRLVVEKGAGPAGLVERAPEQCMHVAAVDVQPDRIGIVPGEDRLLGARHVRTEPTDEAHVAVGRELQSASDARR